VKNSPLCARRAHMCLGSFIFCVSAVARERAFLSMGTECFQTPGERKKIALGLLRIGGNFIGADCVNADFAYLFLVFGYFYSQVCGG